MGSLRLRVVCVAWAGVLIACAGSAATTVANPEYEGAAFETESSRLAPGLDFSISRGKEDTQNRYEAVVQVRSERGCMCAQRSQEAGSGH